MKYNSKEKNIWFTSDTHYGHKNICKATSSWDNKDTYTRDFKDVPAMNDFMVNSINELVMPDDILFHLGDWVMGGYDNIWRFRKRLNVNEIHLILGNHDQHIKKNKVFQTLDDTAILDQFGDSAKNMFTTIQDYLEIRVDGQLIVMSHFPMASWNELDRGSWMLHGHTHGMLFNDVAPGHWYKNSKIFDVGLDSNFKELGSYAPFSFREIRSIMNRRETIINDYNR